MQGMCWYGLVLLVAEREVLKGDSARAARSGGFHCFAGSEGKEEAYDGNVSEGAVSVVVGERSG